MNNLGVIRKKRDFRDFKLSRHQGLAGSPTAPAIPTSYMPTGFWNMQSESQGPQPDCGGASGDNLQTYELFLKQLNVTPGNIPPYLDLSMRFLYAACKTLDGFPGQGGTTIRAIGQALQKYGISTEALVPNAVGLSQANFADWKQMPAAAIADAATRKSQSYLFLDKMTMADIKQAIYLNGGIILELKYGNQWTTAANGVNSYLEKDILPLRTTGNFQWVDAHFVMAGAYDENYIYFINSFGPQWGRNGFGYFAANYIPYVLDGLSISEIPVGQLTQVQYNWYESIIIFIQQQLTSIISAWKGRNIINSSSTIQTI